MEEYLDSVHEAVHSIPSSAKENQPTAQSLRVMKTIKRAQFTAVETAPPVQEPLHLLPVQYLLECDPEGPESDVCIHWRLLCQGDAERPCLQGLVLLAPVTFTLLPSILCLLTGHQDHRDPELPNQAPKVQQSVRQGSLCCNVGMTSICALTRMKLALM